MPSEDNFKILSVSQMNEIKLQKKESLNDFSQ